MDMREYRYILTIADCGSISRAAEKLYISQPSLSMYVKKLEKQLGITFFERSQGTLSLTPEAILYVDYARQIMRLNDNLHQQLEDYQNLKNGLVRMGVTRSRAAEVLPKILPKVMSEYPDIKLEIVEDVSSNLEKQLELRELDFAILADPAKDSATQNLGFIHTGNAELVLAISEKNEICQRGRKRKDSPYLWMDIHWLRDESFILLKQGQQVRQRVEEVFSETEFVPHILYETASAYTADELTRAGLGLSFVFDTFYQSMGERMEGIQLFSIGNPRWITKIGIAYNKDSEPSKLVKEIRNCVKAAIFFL